MKNLMKTLLHWQGPDSDEEETFDEPMQDTCAQKPAVPDLPPIHPNEVGNTEQYEIVSNKRAQDLDFQFFRDVMQSNLCPEFNRYNANWHVNRDTQFRPRHMALFCQW